MVSYATMGVVGEMAIFRQPSKTRSHRGSPVVPQFEIGNIGTTFQSHLDESQTTVAVTIMATITATITTMLLIVSLFGSSGSKDTKTRRLPRHWLGL